LRHPEVHRFEVILSPARKTYTGSCPENAIDGFMDRFDAGSRQPLQFPEAKESIAIVPEQPVLRAYPQEPGSILEHHLNGEVLKAFFLTVELEGVTLRDNDLGAEES
jgi:hypothetical protein